VAGHSGAPHTMPALLHRMSVPPKRSRAVANMADRSSSRVTSTFTNSALPPVAVMAATVSSPPLSSMSATTTDAPLAASDRAQARPMPDPAPVMTLTLPAISMG
jgi:hypothetical protein